ncbi:MAG: hypothetical protein IT550_12825 [Novosphingobium sp.]|nr:hypothetical protein [Novosphingobium sp.]
MKRTIACLVLTLAVAGCDRAGQRDETQSDAQAVAQVEAAQKRHPAPVLLAPQPLAQPDRAENPAGDTARAGCAFLLESAWTDAPVAVAGPDKAIVKFNGKADTLAADSGSPEIAPGTHTRYAGRGLSMRLTKGPGKGTRATGGNRAWPGSLTLFDRYERVVYFSPGIVQCPA